jgi:hypothetical protein
MVFEGNEYCQRNGCGDILISSFGPEIFVAIFLMVFIFLVPIFSRELRKSRSIILTYWFVVFLHQVVAFLNAHFFTRDYHSGTYGASYDANFSFHLIAKELTLREEFVYRSSNLSVPLSLDSFFNANSFYYELLGSLYQWFGSSLLIGEQFSILVFALSCIVFLKIIRKLELDKYPALSLVVFGAMPTMVLLGSITLRESYQVFFFMLAVFLGVKTFIDRKLDIPCFFLMIMSAFLLALFHMALAFFSVCMIVLFMVWPLRPVSRFRNMKKFHLVAIVLVPLFSIGILSFTDNGSNIFLLFERLLAKAKGFDGEHTIAETIMRWRGVSTVMSGRTTYDVALDSSSPFMLIYSVLKIYGYYLFAGFSMRINSVFDVYAILEAILRSSLLWFSVLTWWKAVGFQKRLLSLMLILYVGMSFMWAIGVTNVGTAMRHHLLTWWIIVSMGLPLLISKLKIIWLSWVHQSKRLSE